MSGEECTGMFAHPFTHHLPVRSADLKFNERTKATSLSYAHCELVSGQSRWVNFQQKPQQQKTKFNKDSFSKPPQGPDCCRFHFVHTHNASEIVQNLLPQETFDIFVSEMDEMIMFHLSHLWSVGDLLHLKSSPK